MIKVPATERGPAGDPPAHRRGHQRQHHAAVLAGGLRAGRRGLSGRPRGSRRAGRRSRQGRERRELLRQPHRCRGRQAHRRAACAERRADSARRLPRLRGKVAIANAKLAYQRYKRLFAGARWEKLHAKGARVQRLLWASTGTKNKDYSDVLYVEELIAPDTVNTLPPATMDAFRDHGKPRRSLEENIDQAEQVMATLERAGISIDAVTAKLVEEGVQLFADAFDKLLGAVAGKRAAILGDKLDGQTCQAAARAREGGHGLARSRGAQTARSAGSGPATRRSGPAPTRRNGSAGSTSSTEQRKRLGALTTPGRRTSGSRISPTSCCSAWADRASGRRCWPRPSGSRPAAPSFWCSTRPIRRRSGPSKARSIRRERCSSCRASPAARSSPTS